MTGHSCNQMKLYGHGNLNFISSSFIVRGYFLLIIEFLKNTKPSKTDYNPKDLGFSLPYGCCLVRTNIYLSQIGHQHRPKK